MVYVGKLIHSKGVHSLLSAFARVRIETGARLLVIGFGTFREGLEALALALSTGDEKTVERLAELGKLLEGGQAGPLEHFEVSQELLQDAAGMEDDVEFIGPLRHEELTRLLPAAELGVVPSIFPETFGLVAAELAACGVVPFVADHSGLREAGEIVGRGLSFDLHVDMDGVRGQPGSCLDGLPRAAGGRAEGVLEHRTAQLRRVSELGNAGRAGGCHRRQNYIDPPRMPPAPPTAGAP